MQLAREDNDVTVSECCAPPGSRGSRRVALHPAGRPPRADGGYRAVVDPSIQYQTLQGWGTSLAWWANVVGGFPEPARSDYIRKVFDPVVGLGLNVVRYNIGGGENLAYHFMECRAAVPGFEPSAGVWDWAADANQRWVVDSAMSLSRRVGCHVSDT